MVQIFTARTGQVKKMQAASSSFQIQANCAFHWQFLRDLASAFRKAHRCWRKEGIAKKSIAQVLKTSVLGWPLGGQQ